MELFFNIRLTEKPAFVRQNRTTWGQEHFFCSIDIIIIIFLHFGVCCVHFAAGSFIDRKILRF